LEKSHWIKPRDIQSQFDFGTGETLQQWIANEDRQMKSDWQASKDEETAKSDQVKAIVRKISSPKVTDKEWDELSDELSRLSLQTLKTLNEKINPQIGFVRSA
jgi:DNA repair ATPase RecN